ncbi:MAG: 4-hydroxybutyrate--acetyl-CoA CoA transferase, partial [Desulfomonilaceae bacterium]
MITASAMDKHGYFSLGTSCDFASTVARDCDILMIEVNNHMPRVFGENVIHVSEVDSIVENHTPLIQLEERLPSEKDKIIGDKIANLVPHGACLQFGIGNIPDAVAQSLLGHKDLGIHTEMLTNSVVDLCEAGVITNRK